MKEVWDEYNDKATWETKLFLENLTLNGLAIFFLAYIRHEAEKGAEGI